MATKSFHTILSFTLVALAVSLPFSSSCNNSDLKALIAFKNSFPPNTLPNWTNSTDCCFWDGVGCDDKKLRVTSLSFHNSDDYAPIDLVGNIPSSVGDLSALDLINFSDLPNLRGPIPPSLSKLKRLQYITIYNTSVSGPIPSYFSKYAGLIELNILRSKIEGPIPPSLGNLVNLSVIDLSANKLTGSIPGALFGKLRKGVLADLDISENKLTGVVPESFGNVAFTNINFQGNLLTGDASFLFGKSKLLSQIILAKNRLAFDLTEVEYPVQNLQYIDINHNRVFGSISDQIKEVPNLGYLDVSYNELCGKIPSGGNFGSFEKQFYEHNKCLCGAPLTACK